ncbi:uncharacterized protein ARMOST_01845 [Armillaria ostoyae]|uniref:Uncharacterized protein n=1 Tax=Armillaria ostoyae TaxID=47428 RepID=A0A284QQ30_ARMOS|nr:uncharacterized protein ARMOST_01845 [Armillaria ostoyae]
MGAFSTCKWDGTIQFTKSGPIAPRKCTVSAGRVIALMFGILAGLLLLIIIGLHFRQRRTVGPRDVPFTDEEELEELLPVGVPDSEDQSPLPLPPVPPKDKGGAKGTFPEDSLGYGENRDEPPPPYIKE